MITAVCITGADVDDGADATRVVRDQHSGPHTSLRRNSTAATARVSAV
jgi:hypothetical protein